MSGAPSKDHRRSGDAPSQAGAASSASRDPSTSLASLRPANTLLSAGALNVALRGATLASKFVLALLIARYLTPADYGLYGLVNVTVALSLFVLGFDFYVFASRDMLARPEADWPAMIRDQLVFHGLFYLVALPALLGVFALHLLPWAMLGWFYALVVLEHLAQEAYRLLITLSRPVAANAVLFLRSGAWIYAVGAFMWRASTARTLTWVWAGWAVGVAASILLAVWFVRGLRWSTALTQRVDWTWIRAGIGRSGVFLFASFAMRGIEAVDRYFLEAYRGAADVGVYSFYYSFANVVYVFTFAAVVASFHPVLLKSGALPALGGHLKRFALWLGACVVGVALCVAVGFRFVLLLVGKPAYAGHLLAFYVLLGSACLNTASLIPHYALYARNRDAALVISACLALVCAVGAHVTLVPTWGILGSAVATAVGMGVLLVTKSGLALVGRAG